MTRTAARRPITLKDLMQSRYSIYPQIGFAVATFVMAYTGTNMVLVLTEVHGLPAEKANLIMINGTIGFLLGTPIPNILLKRGWCERLTLTYAGFFIIAVGVFFRTGDIFGEPKLWVVVISMLITGAGMCMLFITALPEITESIEVQPDLYESIDLDQMSVYLGQLLVLNGAIFRSLGMLLSPIMIKWFGYTMSFIILAIVIFTIMLTGMCLCGRVNPATLEKRKRLQNETELAQRSSEKEHNSSKTNSNFSVTRRQLDINGPTLDK